MCLIEFSREFSLWFLSVYVTLFAKVLYIFSIECIIQFHLESCVRLMYELIRFNLAKEYQHTLSHTKRNSHQSANTKGLNRFREVIG